MFQGTVKTWLTERAFGFIRSDEDAQRDVFIHASNLLRFASASLSMSNPTSPTRAGFEPSTSSSRSEKCLASEKHRRGNRGISSPQNSSASWMRSLVTTGVIWTFGS